MSLIRTDAPFNEDTVARLRWQQSSGIVHPYTHCGEAMLPSGAGLLCRKCGELQTWAYPLPTKLIVGLELIHQRVMAEA